MIHSVPLQTLACYRKYLRVPAGSVLVVNYKKCPPGTIHVVQEVSPVLMSWYKHEAVSVLH